MKNENWYKPWNWKISKAKRHFENQIHEYEIRGTFNVELYEKYLIAIR